MLTTGCETYSLWNNTRRLYNDDDDDDDDDAAAADDDDVDDDYKIPRDCCSSRDDSDKTIVERAGTTRCRVDVESE